MDSVLACALLLCGCDYIVLPEDLDEPGGAGSGAWSGVVTNIAESDTGDLRIDITLRNETGDWSALQATADKPAVLTAGDGKTVDCESVFVSTGGHRLAPGFQMRGFIAGTKGEPVTQLVYMECRGAEATSGSTLCIDYNYVIGQYNYYEPDATRTDGKLELNLDEIATGLTYPIAESVEGLIQGSDTEKVAVPLDVKGLYILLSAETGKQRL